MHTLNLAVPDWEDDGAIPSSSKGVIKKNKFTTQTSRVPAPSPTYNSIASAPHKPTKSVAPSLTTTVPAATQPGHKRKHKKDKGGTTPAERIEPPAVRDGVKGAGMKEELQGKHEKHAHSNQLARSILEIKAQQEKPKQQQKQAAEEKGGEQGQSDNMPLSKRAKKRNRKKFRETHDTGTGETRGGGSEREQSNAGAKKHKPDEQKLKRDSSIDAISMKSAPTDTKKNEERSKGKMVSGEAKRDQETGDGEIPAASKFPFKDMGAVAMDRRLTPLQAKYANQLQGAHFRMLNEELYTTPSSAAVAMFKKDPSLFDTYHQGFRAQTKKWPSNPVDVILKFLKKYPKWKVADLGCGDAKIAHSLADGQVHSFDLVSVNAKVTACDIAHVPLPNEFVDAVVLSLALMGTNYVQFLQEANRLVKVKGRVLIAEVRSRCEHVLDEFLALLNALGLQVDQVDKDNKMFIMFYLTKLHNCPKDIHKLRLLAPDLKPCQYKRR